MMRRDVCAAGVAALVGVAATACGETARDSGVIDRGDVGGSASIPGGTAGTVQGRAGSSGTAGSVAASGGAAPSGLGGGGGVPAAGGSSGTVACPSADSSGTASFQFGIDPPPEGGATEPDMSEGQWQCTIRAPELENSLMILYLDCDDQDPSTDLVAVRLSVDANPEPSWSQFSAGTEVTYAWRATTHGWGYYWWARLDHPDGTPLLIAYLTGSTFELERLQPFDATVVDSVCPVVEESCFTVEYQRLDLALGGSLPISLFEYSHARLGDYLVWTSRFEAHFDIMCTDQWPFDYGVGIILDPQA
jgi:hypothetical protein